MINEFEAIEAVVKRVATETDSKQAHRLVREFDMEKGSEDYNEASYLLRQSVEDVGLEETINTLFGENPMIGTNGIRAVESSIIMGHENYIQQRAELGHSRLLSFQHIEDHNPDFLVEKLANYQLDYYQSFQLDELSVSENEYVEYLMEIVNHE